MTVTPLPDGTAQVQGRLPATAAAAFDQTLSQLATAVCAKDSRKLIQRRADALSALYEGRALGCDGGQPDCPARRNDAAPPAVATVLNVIATEATAAGESDQPGYLASDASMSLMVFFSSLIHSHLTSGRYAAIDSR